MTLFGVDVPLNFDTTQKGMKWSVDMVDSYLLKKYAINSRSAGYEENSCKNLRTTMNDRAKTLALLTQ